MKHIKQIVAIAFVFLGVLLSIEGYRISRPTYYLTQSGSSPDDYTAGGYMIFAFGIIVTFLASLYIYFRKKKADS